MSASVPAVLVDSFDGMYDQPDGSAGRFKYWRYPTDSKKDGPAGLNFFCPCGCGLVGGLAFRRTIGLHGPIWTWDGNREKPTCTPSIGFYGKRQDGQHHWHGFLTAGEWKLA